MRTANEWLGDLMDGAGMMVRCIERIQADAERETLKRQAARYAKKARECDELFATLKQAQVLLDAGDTQAAIKALAIASLIRAKTCRHPRPRNQGTP